MSSGLEQRAMESLESVEVEGGSAEAGGSAFYQIKEDEI
jgi:hypothetical protein